MSVNGWLGKIRKEKSSATPHSTDTDLPTVDSSDEWFYFLTHWQDYTDTTKINSKVRVIQLLECRDKELFKDLTHPAGGSLTNKSDKEVLASIKTMTVREENITVA